MDAGARVIHVDVMDGHFVPPISIGALIVDALRDLVHDRGGVLDVHLMVERPERRVEEFASAGADSITVHWEATPHVHYALQAVREAGLQRRAWRSTRPRRPRSWPGVADELDHVLCMTVNPGWGGQAYIESSTAKVARLRELLGPDVPIEVDGGIDAAHRAGARARPAPRCSWPARRSSAPTTPPPPTARSPRRPARSRPFRPSSAGSVPFRRQRAICSSCGRAPRTRARAGRSGRRPCR